MPRHPTNLTVTCATCGKVFRRIPSYVRKNKVHYCCRDCWRLGEKSFSAIELFLKQTPTPNEFGCLLWTGTIVTKRYGIVQRREGGRIVRYFAHRLAYEATYGAIPEGLNVLHRCESFYPPGDITCRSCVNPEHLYLGTQADNMTDKVEADRQDKGEDIWSAKLTEDGVRTIRRLRAEGWRVSRIATLFDVDTETIYCILKRKTWRHVD